MSTSSAQPGPRLAVDVAGLIDRAPIGRPQIKIFALCFAISLLDGFDTMVMSFLAPAISHAWHASHAAFGLVFSATLLGGALGATGFGLLADRFGRKGPILVSAAWFGLVTLLCAGAPNLASLVVLRFVAGLGLGGAIPNILALAGEYAPTHRRATVVSIITWGTPLGAVLGGLVSGPMLDAWGWRSVIALAGLAPLVLLPGLWIALPESIRFLAVRDQDRTRLRATLAHVVSQPVPAEAHLVVSEARPARTGLAALFRDGLAPGTILLTATMFMSLILSFFLVNWAPTLLAQAGLPMRDAILGTIVLNLSGVIGSLGIARLVDRSANGPRILAWTYVCAALAVVAVALATRGHPRLAPVLIGLAASGGFLIGSQITLSGYITTFFPTALRATGVGFNNAFARLGSLLGPAAGGLLLGAGVAPARLLAVSALPGALSATCLFLLAARHVRAAGTPHAKVPDPAPLRAHRENAL